MGSCCSLDQLRSNAYPTAGPAYRAFQDIAHTQFAPDLLHINRTPFVGEGRIPGDDKEPFDPRESGNDFLDHAISEIFLLGIAAHVLEWQHRYRRLVWQRRRRLRWRLYRWFGA